MTTDPASDPALARQRLASFASVAALIVHSARNRLTVVRTGLELLQARMEADLGDEERASFLRQLDLFLEEFNLGAEMVRCHQGAIEPVSARETATEALEVVRARAARSGISLQAVYQDDPDTVRADRGLLRVALLNLLRNALEALEESPRENGAPARIRLRVAAAGARCRLQVEDNGPGVPEALRDRLFTDFVTGRAGAAGLGLCLCRDAMALMAGSISHLTPRGRRGAKFRLELDLWRPGVFPGPIWGDSPRSF